MVTITVQVIAISEDAQGALLCLEMAYHAPVAIQGSRDRFHAVLRSRTVRSHALGQENVGTLACMFATKTNALHVLDWCLLSAILGIPH